MARIGAEHLMGEARSVVPREVLRVHVLTATGAPLGQAVVDALRGRPDVQLTGIETGPIELSRLRELKPDILISAGHQRFIGASSRSVPRVGAVGLHPSLLPRYRGSHPLWWALRRRESKVGLTLYVLDDGIDTGRIVSQREVPVLKGDTFSSLYSRVARMARPMVDELVEHAATLQQLPPTMAQDDSQASTFRRPNLLLRAWFKAFWSVRARFYSMRGGVD